MMRPRTLRASRFVATWGALFICFLAGVPGVTIAAPGPRDPGEQIYRQGVLPDGSPLRGARAENGTVEGAQAACINCHRRSGLGAAEGQNVVPPITARYLFRPSGQRPEDMDFKYAEAYRLDREPYADDAAVARAIREGIGKGGKPLSVLMPRFQLDDGAMRALVAYLKSLSPTISPGVTDDTIHFATIITPDADPRARQGMLDVLNKFIEDKNDFRRGGVRPLHSSRDIRYRVTRGWNLHVWELVGPPATWEEQLKRHLAAEPVFAVLSGLGGGAWAPVHHFCETAKIPCLFPNVSAPVDQETDFYSLYFSKGVELEAQLIAAQMSSMPAGQAPQRVVQLYREGDAGAAGARALARLLEAQGRNVVSRPVGAGPESLNGALKGIAAADGLVLWLRPADLRPLAEISPIANSVFLSGLLAGLESAPLAPRWRAVTKMTYPVDLPEARRFRLNLAQGWFRIRHIDVVAEQVQADTYTACGIVSEMLNDMLESFYRDFLVERIESMLGRRALTGYYPRLSLAPGQRFASKGGFIVHFTDPEGPRVAADTPWNVP